MTHACPDALSSHPMIFEMKSHLALSLDHVLHAVQVHDRLIAPRRLSRMWRKACSPQKTKKPWKLLASCDALVRINTYDVYKDGAEYRASNCATILGVFMSSHYGAAVSL
jgi:hypothetical protein